MIFNSIYQPENVTGGVLGTSLIDLTSTSFAELFAQATNYGAGVTYKKGDLAYDQNSIWVYINNTASSGNPPPTLPTISNAYWELVGTQTTQTFVWIAYANSADGATDFTTGTYDSGGITRAYIGIAVNKTSAVESTNYVDYIWARFKGADGTSGVSPILVSLSRPTVNIMTDSNGDNGIYTNSGTNISVLEGLTTLEYDGVGTSSGTWRISSVVASNITAGSTAADSASYAIINNHSAITASTASITYNITGKNGSGIVFTTSVIQTFTRAIGTVVDTTPPGQVAGLTLTTSTETLAGGSIQVKLKATWTANADADLSYYEPEIKLTAAADTTYIGYQTATNSYEWPVTAGTSYTVRVRAADKSDNKGAYSTAVALVSGTDSVAPGVPTALTAIATFKNIFLSWTNTNGATDTDLAAVEIWEATTNNSASATKIATVNAVKGAPGGFTRSGIVNGTTYYYFLKSVDTSNNSSGFTATNSVATNQSSVTVATNGAFTFTGNSTGLSLGNVVIITGTLGGTGTISGYSSGTNYVVSATDGSTTATLVAANGTALTTTAGTLTGLTFTVVRSAAIPAAVGTSDIIVGSITADRVQSGTLTGDRFNTTTSLPATITVGATGVTIGTVQTDAATGATNPTTRINAGATTIDPGKILISGATTLANWRNGSDATKIEGGSLATNTVSANKLQIGMRGVDIAGIQFQANESTNVLSWTAGTITYTKDDGTVTTVSITAGNTTWSSGTLYIYWVKNDTTPNTTLQSNTATGTAYGANNIVFATYRGGVDFVANYGRTIIDGSQITTGTVNADRFKADSIIGNRLYVGGTNFRINGAEQGAGKGTLTVSDGTVDLIKLGYIDATTVGFQIKNTTGETVISSTTTAASINNSNITVNASGQLTGIGTGVNTTVANSQIAVNGSGQLTGIGTGVNTTVANSQIAVNGSGELTGIGTGANTVVDNTKVSVGGRNLILGSASGAGWSGFTTRTNSTFSLTAASTGETAYIYSPYFNMWGNQEITLSFESAEDSSILSRDLFILPDNYASIGLLTQSFSKSASGYTKYSFTFTTPAGWGTITSPASVRFRMDHNGSTAGVSATINIRNVKLELGNKATDWSPAPEDLVSVDLTNAPSTIKNSSITVSGGAISGIGTGSGTVVANSSIAVDASGQLTGIGTGANTVVANSQITVSGGALNGIGTGSGTVVANSAITVNGSGQLTGIGTGVNTTIANSQITISGGAISGIGTGSGTAVANANITMNSNGSISGAGGGQVTIGGLGYTGALNATNGATIGTNLGGTFTEAEFNNRFTTNTINGTFIKNATIDTAQIKDLAVSGAKIVNAAITNAKIGNLEVDSAKIANLTIGTQKIEDLAISRSSSSYYNFNGYSYPTDQTWYELTSTISSYVFVGAGNGSYSYQQVGTSTKFGFPEYDYVSVGAGNGDYNYVIQSAGLVASILAGTSSQTTTQVVNIEAVVAIERDGGNDDTIKARIIRTNDSFILPELYNNLRVRSGISTYGLSFRDPSPISGAVNTYKVQLYNINDNCHIYEAAMRATLFRK